MLDNLSLSQIARNPSESVRPDLWPAHAWVPALGIQGATLWDVAGKRHGLLGSHSWTSDRGVDFEGGGACVVSGDTADLQTASKCTIICDCRRTSIGVNWSHVIGMRNGGTYQWQFRIAGTNGAISFLGESSVNSALSMNSRERAVIALVRDGSSGIDFYKNSVKSSTSSPSITDRSLDLTIGNQSDSTQGCMIYSVSYYSAILHDTQIRDLSADPLLPLRKRLPMVSFYVPSGGSTFKPWWAKNVNTLIAS